MNIHWFRRDLRLEDNTALISALEEKLPVQCLFIFDKNILDKLASKKDKRVSYIYERLKTLDQSLRKLGSSLWVFYGTPEDVYRQLLDQYDITAVYTNEDYESYAIDRDAKVAQLLASNNSRLISCKDQVVFAKDEVVKKDGNPYTVFTPYAKVWWKKYQESTISQKSIKGWEPYFRQQQDIKFPSMEAMGFQFTDWENIPENTDASLLQSYENTRDIPAIAGTSRMSVALRFGTVSIRQLMKHAANHSKKYADELVWREFYQMILWHFPKSANACFKPAYEGIRWENNERHFQAWCEGKTGYPLVDAGMRELNETGFMHNRIRMLTASFLCKHLLIDWRWGANYFAEKLMDFDLASNAGGWQWASGTGCDAAPYFRVFNPDLQQKKFDPDFTYINRWVPEWQDPFSYPSPIVDHKMARERALSRYKETLQK